MAAEWISGNIFIRRHCFSAVGEGIDGHTHNFDHTSIVFTGAVHVKAETPDGRIIEQDFRAPSHFLVKADVKHQITAIEPGTQFWCVYSHRDPQARITQEYDGWEAAYT